MAAILIYVDDIILKTWLAINEESIYGIATAFSDISAALWWKTLSLFHPTILQMLVVTQSMGTIIFSIHRFKVIGIIADMDNPNKVYELLLDASSDRREVERIVIGQVWTVCQAGHSGLAMSPAVATRTLPWAGTLQGKSLTELTPWVKDWNPFKATLGLAAINCSLNSQESLTGKLLEPESGKANLAVFEYFFPQIKDKKMVVIGHYPGIEQYYSQYNLTVIERQPVDRDYPDSAAEYLVADADWVFVTATSIANKTFPRLMQLSANTKTVLMGPSTPWLTELHEFGVDYLVGVDVVDDERLYQTAAEGGGVRIFDSAVRYKVVDLSSGN